jgi:hypothetical protein
MITGTSKVIHMDALGTIIADRPRTDPYKRFYAYGSHLGCALHPSCWWVTIIIPRTKLVLYDIAA